MLLVHWIRRAASRAAWTAGNKSAISTAMMAITTRSSIKVKPRRRIDNSPQYKIHTQKKESGHDDRERGPTIEPAVSWVRQPRWIPKSRGHDQHIG